MGVPDKSDVSELVERYDEFLAYAMSISRGREVAEEILQRAYVRALEHLSDAKEIRPWMYRIIFNEYMTYLDRERVYKPLRDHARPDRRVPQEVGEGLERALARLCPEDRHLIRGRAEGRKGSELYEEVGLNAGQARLRIFRARKLLRRELAHLAVYL